LNNIEDFGQVNQALSELNQIYQEWLDIFPFELEMFKGLKEKFATTLPIIKESKWTLNDKVNEIEINICSNKSFFQFLSEKTTSILAEINTLVLFEENLIDDIEKHKLELLKRKRRHKLTRQVQRSRYQKPSYIEYISEWFDDEKEFIEEIIPYFNTNRQVDLPSKKYRAKDYAFLHTIHITLGIEDPFEINEDGFLKKSEIVEFAEEKYDLPNGQGFYKAYSDIRNSSPEQVADLLGKGYKEMIIELSCNNHKVTQHLKKYPD